MDIQVFKAAAGCTHSRETVIIAKILDVRETGMVPFVIQADDGAPGMRDEVDELVRRGGQSVVPNPMQFFAHAMSPCVPDEMR